MASLNRPLMLRSSSTPVGSDSTDVLAQHVQEFSNFTSYTFSRNLNKVRSISTNACKKVKVVFLENDFLVGLLNFLAPFAFGILLQSKNIKHFCFK